MVYSPHPPYEILSTKLLDYSTLQELRRFAKYWDVVANSGNFVATLSYLWDVEDGDGKDDDLQRSGKSPFGEFRRLAGWLFAREKKTQGLPLTRLVELLFQYLTEVQMLPAADVAATLWQDYQRGGRSDKPHCLRPFIENATTRTRESLSRESGPKRQARHWVEPANVLPGSDSSGN